MAAGGATTLTGVLSGTDGADRRIIVKSNPWPYTQGFLPVGNELVTNDDGSFSVPVLSVAGEHAVHGADGGPAGHRERAADGGRHARRHAARAR